MLRKKTFLKLFVITKCSHNTFVKRMLNALMIRSRVFILLITPFCYLHRLSSQGEQKSPKEGELEFPKELTEGWSTMDVCSDCKKFITDIICSSKRSLSMANSRSRLKRKTQSFYRARDYRPSERTIKEV